MSLCPEVTQKWKIFLQSNSNIVFETKIDHGQDIFESTVILIQMFITEWIMLQPVEKCCLIGFDICTHPQYLDKWGQQKCKVSRLV